MSPAAESSKAEALKRGRNRRRPDGPPSATPLPPDDTAAVATPERPTPLPGRRPAGHGRRGHLRKLSVEMAPDEHDRLKLWLLTAFGGSAAAAPVLRALLAEAYTDPALTERVRARLASRD